MKIQQNQIKFFLEGGFRKYKAVLIFGSNSGLVAKRCSILQKKSTEQDTDSSLNITHLGYEQISKDPSVLQEELCSYSLFNKPKVIMIKNAGASINKDIQQILSSIPDGIENFIIFTSDELPPSSTTRKFFETAKDLAAIPCYMENIETIKNLVMSKLSARNIRLSSHEVIDYIVENIQGDHLAIISEIEKIILSASSDKVISLRDVKNIISKHTLNLDYQEMIKYIVRQDLVRAETEFTKLINSGISVIAIIRNLTNYFVKLVKVKSLISQGKSEDVAMSFLKPPIFYKHEKDFKFALKKYSLHELINIFDLLIKFEIDCKSYNIDNKILWDQTFVHIFFSLNSP